MENIKKIVFNRGEESGIVIQRDDFEHSLLQKQYHTALRIIDDIWTRQAKVIEDNRGLCKYATKNSYVASNIVAFCGDRGEGKTSCMMTIQEILSNPNTRDAYNELKTGRTFVLDNKKVETLKTIEPAHFDKSHNVVELLLGQMYMKFNSKQIPEKDYAKTLSQRNELKKAFAAAQTNLSILHDGDRNELRDRVEDLEHLSASMNLSDSIRVLFKGYLEYMGKAEGRILVCIDDIDLNMTEAHLLMESVRKYLSNEYCILLMALNVEQLKNVIESNIANTDSRYLEKNEYINMAEKFVAKVLPLQNRVNMPHVIDFAEIELEIKDNRDGKNYSYTYASVKEAIVSLISEKTHYLFYNKRGEVSPIVPYTLREMRHLMGLLMDMNSYIKACYAQPDENEYENQLTTSQKKIDKSYPSDSQNPNNLYNQEIFRNYIYHVWVKELKEKDRKFADELLRVAALNTVNKFVCEYLRIRYSNWIKLNVYEDKKIELDETEKVTLSKSSQELLKNIFSETTIAYNISVGDVLYIIRLFEKTMTDKDSTNLFFFIKSYYSIQLYEMYNRITEQEGKEYPDVKQNTDINREDLQFKNVNVYQKFTNGSVFTYVEGDLMSTFANVGHLLPISARDMWKINTEKLYQEMTRLTTEVDNKRNEKEEAEFKHQFQLCEYLLLSSVHSSASVINKNNLCVDRRTLNPFYVGEYNHNNVSYMVYDPLALFSNCSNIEYAYRRLGGFDKQDNGFVDFYETAKTYSGSLYNAMCDAVVRKDDKELSPKELIVRRHLNLVSNATIRNVDIQFSIIENIISRRNSISRESNTLTDTLWRFYENILEDTHINYYSLSKGEYYHTTFNFLLPVVDLLKNYLGDKDFHIYVKVPTINDEKKKIKNQKRNKRNVNEFVAFIRLFRGLESYLAKIGSIDRGELLLQMADRDKNKIYLNNKELIDSVMIDSEYTLKTFRETIKPVLSYLNK